MLLTALTLAVAVDLLACEIDYKSHDGTSDQHLVWDVALPREPWDSGDPNPDPTVTLAHAQASLVLKLGAGHLDDVRLTIRNAMAVKHDAAGVPEKAAQSSCTTFSLMFPDSTSGIGCIITTRPFDGRFLWPQTTLVNGQPVFDPARSRVREFENDWGRVKLGCQYVRTIP